VIRTSLAAVPVALEAALLGIVGLLQLDRTERFMKSCLVMGTAAASANSPAWVIVYEQHSSRLISTSQPTLCPIHINVSQNHQIIKCHAAGMMPPANPDAAIPPWWSTCRRLLLLGQHTNQYTAPSPKVFAAPLTR